MRRPEIDLLRHQQLVDRERTREFNVGCFVVGVVGVAGIFHYLGLLGGVVLESTALVVDAVTLVFGILIALMMQSGFVARFAQNLLRRMELRRKSPRIFRGPFLESIVFLLVPRESREHLIGDLEEEYRSEIVPSRTWFGARCWWWGQVFRVVAHYLWKRVRRVLGLEVVRGWRRR